MRIGRPGGDATGARAWGERAIALAEQLCARDVLPWLQEGRIRWAIDRTFSLEEIHDAHAYRMKAEHSGKIVLTID